MNRETTAGIVTVFTISHIYQCQVASYGMHTNAHIHIIYLTFWLYLVWTLAGNLNNVVFLSPIHILDWDLDERKIASFQISKLIIYQLLYHY